MALYWAVALASLVCCTSVTHTRLPPTGANLKRSGSGGGRDEGQQPGGNPAPHRRAGDVLFRLDCRTDTITTVPATDGLEPFVLGNRVDFDNGARGIRNVPRDESTVEPLEPVDEKVAHQSEPALCWSGWGI